MTITQAVMNDSQVLWDYHAMRETLTPADIILVLGSHDLRPARHAAELYFEGKGPTVVCSGGFGKLTRDVWNEPEGVHLKKVLVGHGVPSDHILVEDEATNTGDNFQFTKAMLERDGKKIRSGIVVTKPYMARRAFATGSKQWPGVLWQACGPEVAFADYPNDEVPLERTIGLMVGDLQRIALYPEKGFQIPQEIPPKVWEAYDRLVRAGFDQFTIKD